MKSRNYEEDKEYRDFRKAVRKRDKFKCKMCGSTEKLQVHHIIPWSKSYELRYTVSNGITLCKECHKSITRNEEIWSSYLSSLI